MLASVSKCIPMSTIACAVHVYFHRRQKYAIFHSLSTKSCTHDNFDTCSHCVQRNKDLQLSEILCHFLALQWVMVLLHYFKSTTFTILKAHFQPKSHHPQFGMRTLHLVSRETRCQHMYRDMGLGTVWSANWLTASDTVEMLCCTW